MPHQDRRLPFGHPEMISIHGVSTPATAAATVLTTDAPVSTSITRSSCWRSLRDRDGRPEAPVGRAGRGCLGADLLVWPGFAPSQVLSVPGASTLPRWVSVNFGLFLVGRRPSCSLGRPGYTAGGH